MWHPPGRFRWLAHLTAVCLLAGPARPPIVAQAPAAALRIVIVEGEDAVNIIQQKTAVAPVVEVRDRNDQPVAGAVVTFAIQGGRHASFAAGANTLTVTTNAAGRAVVGGLTPTGTGAVQINVAAAFQGQTAAATITQTNFATAAQAASAGSSASGTSAGAAGGGGGIGAGTITALSAAAAGGIAGAYVYKQYQRGEAPVVDGVSAIPSEVGIQGASTFQFSFGGTSHGDITVIWDFGDGTRTSTFIPVDGLPPEEAMAPQHTFTTAGTFTVRMTMTDAWDRSASGQVTVTIRSLNGRWRLTSNGSFFDLIQSGATVSGGLTSASGQNLGTVSGSVRTQVFNRATPNLTLTVTPAAGGTPSAFNGTTRFETADLIDGVFSSGTTTVTTNITRQ